MKTYLITGASGFIGSHLADHLIQAGHKVINVDNFNDYYDVEIKNNNIAHHLSNENYKLERIDIRDYKELDRVFSENKIDTVVHLAAMAGVRPSIENPILYQEVNTMGSQNLLEIMKQHNVKEIAFASSSSVYGNNDDVPFGESDIVDFAISPYAATKKGNEVLAHVYHKLEDFNVIMLRFFTVYGPRQRPDLAIHKFTKLIIEDKEIPFYGDGTTCRDYTYIDDIIDGVLKSIKYIEENDNVYEVINLGESQTITLNEMVQGIEDTLGKKAIKKVLPMQPGDVNRTFANIDKARNLIGYNPTTKYKDGIKKFIEWYKKK